MLDSPKKPNAASFDTLRDDIFSRIASRYDVLCDLFSLGIHRIWKRRMAKPILAEQWDHMLDVAAGTGDIALRVVQNLGAQGRTCVVSDICPSMLEIAQRRAGPLAGAMQFNVYDAHRGGERERRPLFDVTGHEDLRSYARPDRSLARAEAGRDLHLS